jgi:hypothetical protein
VFHLQSYFLNNGAAAAVNVKANPVSDTTFFDKNNGFIYTEQWSIAALFAKAPQLTLARSNVPKLNSINRHQIHPLNLSATVSTPTPIQDMRKEPLALSLNEPVAWEISDTNAAGEDALIHQIIVPPDWTMELPPHLQRMTVRAQGAVIKVANAWSAEVAITFPDQDLRGGVYSIVGAQAILTGVTAFRFVLTRQPESQGRFLRPGAICMEALSGIDHPMFHSGMGEWGRFHSFELPKVQVIGNAAGAATLELRLDLLYLGEDSGLLMGTM